MTFKSLLYATLLTFSCLVMADDAAHITSTDGANVTEDKPSTCAEVADNLKKIHRKLYDVDTRPLNIDDYRTYRDALTELNAQSPLLDQVCNEKGKSSEQTVYKVKHFETKIENVTYYDCGRIDYKDALEEFQTSSIRECFRDGGTNCTVKLPPRLFNRKTENQNYTWICRADADILLEVSR